MPSVEVSRGNGLIRSIQTRIEPELDKLTFVPAASDQPMSIKDSLDSTFTDGTAVLHQGKIVYEHYSGCLTENNKHAAMSVTKSLVGLLAEVLVAEGKLDEESLVDAVIPELKNSAFGSATVRQVMEMTTSLKYSEDYSDPDADVWVYSAAGSALPKPGAYTGPTTYDEYLQTVKSEGPHGEVFYHKTPNTDVLGWLIARTTNKSVPEVLSERIWSRMGAEQSTFFTVDSIGTPFVGGEFNCGLRDLARVGQLLLDEGALGDERLFPAAAVERLRQGGNKVALAKSGYKTLPGASYRGMWWIYHNEHGAFSARGVHGQALYIDPKARVVIARFASHPTAASKANDHITLPAFHAIAKFLAQLGS